MRRCLPRAGSSVSQLRFPGARDSTSGRITGLRRRLSQELRADVSHEKQAKRFYVSGRVQGVGYRYFVQTCAEKQGLAGYVRNLRDGRVEIYAAGSNAQLSALLAELRRGPRHAVVAQVDQADAPLETDFPVEFSIQYDA
jgi:acylphosphatase